MRTLNSLLRSEITAADSYLQTIPHVSGSRTTDVEALRKIAQEHSQAVQRLRVEIERVGGTPSETSGAWTIITKGVVSGPAQVFVDAAALTALKEGEARGLDEYKAALKALQSVNGSTVSLIKESLIPAQIQHIDALDQMLERL